MKTQDIFVGVAFAFALVALIVAVGARSDSPSLGGYTAGDWEAADDLIAGDDATIGDDATVAGLVTIGETLTVTGETNVVNFVQGGATTTISSTSTTMTALTAAQVCDNSVITLRPYRIGGVGGTSTSIAFASTTLIVADCLPGYGDHRSFILENSATSSWSVTVTTAGNGILLSDDSAGDIISQNGWAIVTMVNVSATEMAIILEPHTDAD